MTAIPSRCWGVTPACRERWLLTQSWRQSLRSGALGARLTSDEWLVARRYLSDGSLALVRQDQGDEGREEVPGTALQGEAAWG